MLTEAITALSAAQDQITKLVLGVLDQYPDSAAVTAWAEMHADVAEAVQFANTMTPLILGLR